MKRSLKSCTLFNSRSPAGQQYRKGTVLVDIRTDSWLVNTKNAFIARGVEWDARYREEVRKRPHERQKGLFKSEMLLQVGICVANFIPVEPSHEKLAVETPYPGTLFYNPTCEKRAAAFSRGQVGKKVRM